MGKLMINGEQYPAIVVKAGLDDTQTRKDATWSSDKINEELEDVRSELDIIVEEANKNTSINDEVESLTTVWSSKKTGNELAKKVDGAYTFGTADATQWLKLTLGNSSKFQPITIADQYGGKVEITGMTNDGTYRSIKLVRYSYGDWTTYSATDYTTTDTGDANYKIRRLYYYPTNGCYYLEIRQWCTIKVSGATTKPEMVTSLPTETSKMTLIPESKYASISDISTNSTSTWSSSKIASEINPTIDKSKVFLNGTLNIATLYTTYGAGRYVAVGQGTTGNGTVTIDIWTLVGGAISYIVNALYSPKTSVMFVGYTYENPTIDFDANYFTHCNYIAKVCTLA